MNGTGRFEAGIRRDAPAGGPAGDLPTDSEPALLEQVRTEIDASGPLTFAQFMAIALYDPDHGYYRTAVDRPVRSGDFLTAPGDPPGVRGGGRPPAR